MNGARLHFEVEGQGPALVLIHAGIADLRMWDEFLPGLRASFKVVRYDLRGFGRSSMPPGFYSHIEDLRALLDFLEVGRAHLVGISYGGRVAMEFAIRYPLRAATLTLVAPGLGGFDWSAQMLAYGRESDRLAEKGDLDALVALDLATWVAGPKRKLAEVDPALVERVTPMVRGANARWAEQNGGTAEWLEPPAASRLSHLRVTTLVTVGAGDLADMISIAGLIGRKVPGARTVVLPGVAHMLPLERPREFTKILREFIGAGEGLPTVRGHR